VDEAPNDEENESGLPLGRLQRVASGTAGVLAAAGGAWAALFGKNQAGSVALLVFGALFLTMSITGSPIEWAKGGGLEVKLRRLQRAVTKAAAEAPPEVSEQLTSALLEATGFSPEVMIRSFASVNYERSVAAALERVKPPDVMLESRPALPDGRFDFLLSRGPQRVAVVAKMASMAPVSAQVVRRWLWQAGMTGGPALLLVTQVPLSEDALEALLG